MGKKHKKGRKKLHNPFEAMKKTMLSEDIEPIARKLYEKAWCGSREVWSELFANGGIKTAPAELREKFISHANKGMR